MLKDKTEKKIDKKTRESKKTRDNQRSKPMTQVMRSR